MSKSVITLTAIFDLCLDSFEVRKVLVIAPLRVARDTWPSELRKWDHLKGLTFSVAVGTEAERKAALAQDAFVYIINRENVQWLVEQSGLPFDFDMVVIDELSSFKSYQAKRFRALMKVRPGVKRIVGLTGTPSSNGLMDLWAEFRLLDMGKRLGRFITHYRTRYFTPDKRNGMAVFSYKPLPCAEEQIYKAISDITVSMKAADHLRMPELIMNEVPVTLSEKEREIYEEMRRELVVSLGDDEIDAVNAAALAGKLSQMANGAVYGEDRKTIPIHCRKLDTLVDILEAANGKPVLVAYWFKHDLDRIMPRKPKKPCRWPGCPNLTDSLYCEEHAAQARRQYDRFERAPDVHKKYGRTWSRIRNRYAMEHPLCERCLKDGRLTPVQEVHHIVPISKGGTHDMDNLMSLCQSCHTRIHLEMGDRQIRN